MAIKETHKILAGQYFIEYQMSVAEIARRLNISKKTLHNWKKEGNWDAKRTQFLKSQYSTNQTLYELVHLIATKAVEDFKTDGTVPDQKTLYFISAMSNKLLKLKAYEQSQAEEKLEEINKNQAENKPEINKEDVLDKVFKALME